MPAPSRRAPQPCPLPEPKAWPWPAWFALLKKWVMLWEFVIDPQTEHKEYFPAQVAAAWTQVSDPKSVQNLVQKMAIC